jgi:type I restriction enzyme S subunit
MIDNAICIKANINRNLEAMAKQLYDYWFVQFDFPDENGRPYKSSGGKMVWNEKLNCEIPDGWNAQKLSELANTYSGGTPQSTKSEYYNGGDIPWINSGELNEPIITKAANYITRIGLEESSAKLYPANTILVALYGATAGKIGLLTFEACSNQAVCGVMPHNKHLCQYIRFYLTNLYDHFVSISSGSARDNISQNTIKETIVIVPPHQVLSLFNGQVSVMVEKVVQGKIEIDNLVKQRDELLPLLMNGQVSVTQPAVNCDLVGLTISVIIAFPINLRNNISSHF